MLRFIVNKGNLRWFTGNRNWPRYVYTIYLNQICIGTAKICLLGIRYGNYVFSNTTYIKKNKLLKVSLMMFAIRNMISMISSYI